MQRLTRSRILTGTVTCLVLLGLSLATAAVRMERMTGKIAAIDAAAQTVVVKVPLGKGTFTIGGPLSPQAVVTKGKHRAQLQDLQVGAQVTVTWQSTVTGHEITHLDAR